MLLSVNSFPKFKCHANVGPNAESLTTITNDFCPGKVERLHFLPEGFHVHLPDGTCGLQ